MLSTATPRIRLPTTSRTRCRPRTALDDPQRAPVPTAAPRRDGAPASAPRPLRAALRRAGAAANWAGAPPRGGIDVLGLWVTKPAPPHPLRRPPRDLAAGSQSARGAACEAGGVPRAVRGDPSTWRRAGAPGAAAPQHRRAPAPPFRGAAVPVPPCRPGYRRAGTPARSHLRRITPSPARQRRPILAAALALAAAAPLRASRPSTPEGASASSPRRRRHLWVLGSTADRPPPSRPGRPVPASPPFRGDPSADVSLGRRSAARGFGRGLLIGGGIGAGVGIVAGLASGDDDEVGFLAMTAQEKALAGGVVAGLVGGVVGGLIGALGPGERWERVDSGRIAVVAPTPAAARAAARRRVLRDGRSAKRWRRPQSTAQPRGDARSAPAGSAAPQPAAPSRSPSSPSPGAQRRLAARDRRPCRRGGNGPGGGRRSPSERAPSRIGKRHARDAVR